MTLPLLYHWLGPDAYGAAVEWFSFEQLCREADVVIESQDYE